MYKKIIIAIILLVIGSMYLLYSNNLIEGLNKRHGMSGIALLFPPFWGIFIGPIFISIAVINLFKLYIKSKFKNIEKNKYLEKIKYIISFIILLIFLSFFLSYIINTILNINIYNFEIYDLPYISLIIVAYLLYRIKSIYKQYEKLKNSERFDIGA